MNKWTTPESTDEIHAQIGDHASGIAVGKQVTQNVTQHFYNYSTAPAAPSVDFEAIEPRYQEQVVRHYRKLALILVLTFIPDPNYL
ncbi:hypothetical protein BH10CHL1_BH10CHL1_11040 [soil metagenome]